jgi:hypothetical protein
LAVHLEATTIRLFGGFSSMKTILLISALAVLTGCITSCPQFSNVTSNSAEAPISPIRDVDFRNFTYPYTEELVEPLDPEQTFTLKEGERPETRNRDGQVDGMGIYLREVKYGDATGDNREEAIVTMNLVTGGTSQPGIVYVYAFEGGGPKLLWGFVTGDRADGGLRSVRAEDGSLVVELNSPDGSRGDCCPAFFTRIKYRWTGERFQESERLEKLPVPEAPSK